MDLGDAEAVDGLIRELRVLIGRVPAWLGSSSEREFELEYQAVSTQLFTMIMAPLLPDLPGAKTLYVAPDSELHRVPFAALVDASGQYLIESYDIAYLSCGRDLLRTFAEAGQGTEIFANPDYNLALARRQVEGSPAAVALRGPLSRKSVACAGGRCQQPPRKRRMSGRH